MNLANPADLDGLWPAGPAGRVLVTCADAAAIPATMQVLPVGVFNSREALSHLMERPMGTRASGSVRLTWSVSWARAAR